MASVSHLSSTRGLRSRGYLFAALLLTSLSVAYAAVAPAKDISFLQPNAEARFSHGHHHHKEHLKPLLHNLTGNLDVLLNSSDGFLNGENGLLQGSAGLLNELFSPGLLNLTDGFLSGDEGLWNRTAGLLQDVIPLPSNSTAAAALERKQQLAKQLTEMLSSESPPWDTKAFLTAKRQFFSDMKNILNIPQPEGLLLAPANNTAMTIVEDLWATISQIRPNAFVSAATQLQNLVVNLRTLLANGTAAEDLLQQMQKTVEDLKTLIPVHGVDEVHEALEDVKGVITDQFAGLNVWETSAEGSLANLLESFSRLNSTAALLGLLSVEPSIDLLGDLIKDLREVLSKVLDGEFLLNIFQEIRKSIDTVNSLTDEIEAEALLQQARLLVDELWARVGSADADSDSLIDRLQSKVTELLGNHGISPFHGIGPNSANPIDVAQVLVDDLMSASPSDDTGMGDQIFDALWKAIGTVSVPDDIPMVGDIYSTTTTPGPTSTAASSSVPTSTAIATTTDIPTTTTTTERATTTTTAITSTTSVRPPACAMITWHDFPGSSPTGYFSIARITFSSPPFPVGRTCTAAGAVCDWIWNIEAGISSRNSQCFQVADTPPTGGFCVFSFWDEHNAWTYTEAAQIDNTPDFQYVQESTGRTYPYFPNGDISVYSEASDSSRLISTFPLGTYTVSLKDSEKTFKMEYSEVDLLANVPPRPSWVPDTDVCDINSVQLREGTTTAALCDVLIKPIDGCGDSAIVDCAAYYVTSTELDARDGWVYRQTSDGISVAEDQFLLLDSRYPNNTFAPGRPSTNYTMTEWTIDPVQCP